MVEGDGGLKLTPVAARNQGEKRQGELGAIDPFKSRPQGSPSSQAALPNSTLRCELSNALIN